MKVDPSMPDAMILFMFMVACLVTTIVFAIGLSLWDMFKSFKKGRR
jgi:hypothetical protein